MVMNLLLLVGFGVYISVRAHKSDRGKQGAMRFFSMIANLSATPD
jgi:hypothetical protein